MLQCVAVPGKACQKCQDSNKDCTHASNVATPAPIAAASHPAGYNTPTAVGQVGSDHVGQRQAGPPRLLPEHREINTLPMAGLPGAAWNSQGSSGYPQPPASQYGSDPGTGTSRMGNIPHDLA